MAIVCGGHDGHDWASGKSVPLRVVVDDDCTSVHNTILIHTRGVAFFGYNFSLRLHGRHGIRGTRTSVKCASVRPVLAPFFARAYRPKSWKLSLLSSAPRKVLGVWCEDIPVRLGTELGILEEHHTPLAASLHSLTLAGKNKGS